MTTRIAIAGVSERDIDLLLLEEFQSSLSFQDWFVKLALGSSVRLGKVIRAERSVTDSTGESDLEIDFAGHDNSITRLMIENKVKAGLQPLQAHRYLLRGQKYLERGRCSKDRKFNGLSTGFRGVWLTPGVAVNRRFPAGMHHDLQHSLPNCTPSTT